MMDKKVKDWRKEADRCGWTYIFLALSSYKDSTFAWTFSMR
jgi:hypothetical protein